MLKNIRNREAGIDLYRSKNNLDQQVECFEKQIKFSIKNKLPLIIHSREAEKETINVLKKYANQILILSYIVLVVLKILRWNV